MIKLYQHIDYHISALAVPYIIRESYQKSDHELRWKTYEENDAENFVDYKYQSPKQLFGNLALNRKIISKKLN